MGVPPPPGSRHQNANSQAPLRTWDLEPTHWLLPMQWVSKVHLHGYRWQQKPPMACGRSSSGGGPEAATLRRDTVLGGSSVDGCAPGVWCSAAVAGTGLSARCSASIVLGAALGSSTSNLVLSSPPNNFVSDLMSFDK